MAIQSELKSELGRVVSRSDLRIFKVICSNPGKQLPNQQKSNIVLNPAEDLQLRALQWLHQQPVNDCITTTSRDEVKSLFPNGPSLSNDALDIIVADPESML